MTASFYKLSGFQKADIRPLLLTGNSRIWYTVSPHLHEKSFDTIGEALVTQFYNESDRWRLLRQKHSNRKKTENDSVTEFASEIRQLCQRLNVPAEESVNYLLNGLKPELGSYAMLQRPKTFAEAETHAKTLRLLLWTFPYHTKSIGKKTTTATATATATATRTSKKQQVLMSKTTTLHVHFFTVPAQLRREMK